MYPCGVWSIGCYRSLLASLFPLGRNLTMLSNLILYRSLTQTQKASAILDRAGIPNRITRAPKAVSVEGCNHCIQLAQRYLPQALEQLRARGAEPKRVYVTAGDDNFEEVRL